MISKPCAALLSILMASTLLSGGCSLLTPGPQPRIRFFMLDSLSAGGKPVQPVEALPQVAIGVGPIRLPEYLDRRDIIVRTSRNEFELAELNQWAEPLSDTFARVLSDNLSILLGSDKVVAFPWRSAIPVDYQVALQVLQLDGLPGETVALRARWQIFSGDGKRLQEYSYSIYEEKVERPTIDALVTAESRAVERLSREIAAAITRMAK
ncbi:MAG: membrane integrity-associated transporter subunit PqiC [Hyphomicrobiales bacterium]